MKLLVLLLNIINKSLSLVMKTRLFTVLEGRIHIILPNLKNDLAANLLLWRKIFDPLSLFWI